MQQSLSYAGGMIGKTVEGLDNFNDPITGSVVSVRVIEGKAQLELSNGQTLSLDRVTRISEGSGEAAASGSGTPSTAAAVPRL